MAGLIASLPLFHQVAGSRIVVVGSGPMAEAKRRLVERAGAVAVGEAEAHHASLAFVALGIGSLAAWLVVTQLFEFDWLPDWGEVLAVLGLGIGVVLAFALGASLPLLRAKPAQALRAL